MKKAITIGLALAFAVTAGSVMARGKPAEDPPPTTSDCQWVPVAAADVVSPVTQTQADLIMDGHCSGQTPADMAIIYMSAGLTQQNIEDQICKLDTAASFCP